MTNGEKKQLQEKLSTPQEGERTEIRDEALESETGLIEGRVSEIATTSADEKQAISRGQAGQQVSSTDRDEMASDREELRLKLLENAPEIPEMKRQITKKLINKREDLRSDYKKLKRSKDYSRLSMAIMRLRKAIREIEIVARLSIEALREMWLRVVHNFA